MELLVASAPPADVVNKNVAATDVVPATRWDAEIEKEVLVTWLPMLPDASAFEIALGLELI